MLNQTPCNHEYEAIPDYFGEPVCVLVHPDYVTPQKARCVHCGYEP